MPVELTTARGPYRIVEAAPPAAEDGAVVLTLALERADGIERVVFRCRIDSALVGPNSPSDGLPARLAPWLQREFEIVREAALKSIRTDRKLHQLVFDRSHPGPF